MFCPNCGTPLEDFEAFCHNCGHRLAEESAPEVQPDSVAAPHEEVPAPKKKSRKKLIIGITASITALAVGIGAVAFYFVNYPKVYLRTKITAYDKNGDWIQTIEYKYNDQGSPTEIVRTTPGRDQVEREENGFIVYDSVPNGGKQVRTMSYEYNEQGHCVSYENLYEEFDKNGNLLEETVYESTVKLDFKYNYNDDGTIDTIDQRTIIADNSPGDYEFEFVYHYDDQGRLHEISSHSLTSDYEKTCYDFRYDSEGRLSVSTVRKLDGVQLTRYEYDEDGNLEKRSVFIGPSDAPFDDENITGSDQDDGNYDFGEPYYEEEFQYDKKGRVISQDCNRRDTVHLEYDGKFLSRVEYEDDKVIEITDDADEAEDIAEDMGIAMVRDKHGNIIKTIAKDGSYTEIEYESVRLSKQLATQHRSIMYSLHTYVDYQDLGKPQYQSGCALWSYVSFPTNELYEIDVLVRILYGNLKY